MLRSNFSLVYNNLTWVLIRDNANEAQTMSVTNDIENVVQHLKNSM